MSKLESIAVHYIKGIDGKNFKLDLLPNKPSVLVAPNGFGKSSVACAFNSLNNSRIVLEDKHHHNGNLSNSPTLIVRFDGFEYSATGSKNDLSSQFDIYVINNSIVAKAVKRNMGKFSAVSTSLEVASVTLIDTIPPKDTFTYAYSKAKSNFGVAGKILPNLSNLLSDQEFLFLLEGEIDFNELSKARSFKNPLNNIIAEINQHSGTSESIKKWIEIHAIGKLESIASLKSLSDFIQKKKNLSIVDAYFLAVQIAELSQCKTFRSALSYQLYLREKGYFDQLLSSFNTTRHTIKSKEKRNGKKSSLVIDFPKADDVSNGQRDILNFIAQLQQAKRKLKKQNCILIIDEIFDYLDDANLVAFQYYITQIIEDFKRLGKNIYPIMLTHLDPAYFRHFCFNKHKLQIRYLNKDSSLTTSVFLNLVKKRGDPLIEDDVSRYYFHYHPNEIDLQSKFQALSLRKAWGKSFEFYKIINNETNKYLQDKDYDSIAVLLSVRIQIEKLAHDKLPVDKQSDFHTVHGTKKKLEYCLDCGLEISETHFLLGIIYNDDLHWHDNKDYETPLRSKLQNVTIKKLISELF